MIVSFSSKISFRICSSVYHSIFKYALANINILFTYLHIEIYFQPLINHTLHYIDVG